MRDHAAIRRDMLRAEDNLRLALDAVAANLPALDRAMQEAQAALFAVREGSDALGVDRDEVIAAVEVTLTEAREALMCIAHPLVEVTGSLVSDPEPKPKATRKRKAS